MLKFYRYSRYALISAIALAALSIFILNAPAYHARYIINSVGSSVVQLSPPSTDQAGGTGFVVTAKSGAKYTLTNAHVCRVAENGVMHALSTGDSRYSNVYIVEISRSYDLCVLTAAPGLPSLSLGGGLSVNQEVGVVGHPLLEYSTLQRGYVTNFEDVTIAIGYNWENEKCSYEGGQFYDLSNNPYAAFMGITSVCAKSYASARTTVIIYPGNSGSPVVNFWGNVVGVAFASNGQTNQALIVPFKSVIDFLSRY